MTSGYLAALVAGFAIIGFVLGIVVCWVGFPWWLSHQREPYRVLLPIIEEAQRCVEWRIARQRRWHPQGRHLAEPATMAQEPREGPQEPATSADDSAAILDSLQPTGAPHARKLGT